MLSNKPAVQVQTSLLHMLTGREVVVGLSQGRISPVSGFGNGLHWEEHASDIHRAITGDQPRTFMVQGSSAWD